MQRETVIESLNENVEYNMFSNDGSAAHELDGDCSSEATGMMEKGPEPHEDGGGFGGIDGRVRPEATTTGSSGGPEGHSIHDSAEAPSALSAVANPLPGRTAYMNVVNDGSMPEEHNKASEEGDQGAKKKTALQVMNENAQKAEVEAGKRTRQVDLDGKELELPPGVKETKKVTKKSIYTIEKFKLSINEDDLFGFASPFFLDQRKIVVAKLRWLPDVGPCTDDYDESVEEMIGILTKASIILRTENPRKAMRSELNKGVA
jgi:hypothetical protein